jgi:hypothetical protein
MADPPKTGDVAAKAEEVHHVVEISRGLEPERLAELVDAREVDDLSPLNPFRSLGTGSKS